jgi:hypothetical protein
LISFSTSSRDMMASIEVDRCFRSSELATCRMANLLPPPEAEFMSGCRAVMGECRQSSMWLVSFKWAIEEEVDYDYDCDQTDWRPCGRISNPETI